MKVEGIISLLEENKKFEYEEDTNFCVIFKDKNDKRLVMTFATKEEAEAFKEKCLHYTHFDKETGKFE